ncbi:MAG: DUF1648 domain-containing protein [Oscillospiraceae bacterium]|nr:DUF1648 domain-containing protein [Oscillospiraceae bacterium]
MGRIIKTIHIALTVISCGIFMSSLIRIVVVWNSLPDNIGVHFAGNGEFDVFGSKNYVAYPYIVSVIALVFCEISALLSKKISEKGDIKIRTALRMLLDVFKLRFSFFFSGVWADCVIRQHPLNTNIPAAIMLIMFFIFFVFVIASIVIKIKNPPE